MQILLIVFDLYKERGGGHTAYRKIVQEEVMCQFHYFLRYEDASTPRPSNTHPILLRARRRVLDDSTDPLPVFQRNALECANQIARSVRGRHFDIVDIPDFLNFGAALRTAFAHHKVTFGRIVLAMHGTSSSSFEMRWERDDSPLTLASLCDQRLLEREQFGTADAHYGFSERYLEDWQCRTLRTPTYIDPIHLLPPRQLRDPASIPPSAPSIYCVGRSERLKGNDLFVELTRWLRLGSYAQAAHIGDEDTSHFGRSSSAILDEMATRRGLSIPHYPALDWDQLKALYQKNTILILPVRYDTLNLVALEALFSGCPIAVSTRAGVCDYLDRHHPDIPYIKIDLDNLYSAVGPIQDLIDHYFDYRSRLHTALTAQLPATNPALGMRNIYMPYPSTRRNSSRESGFALRFQKRYLEGHYDIKSEFVLLGRKICIALLPQHAYEQLRHFWLAQKGLADVVLLQSDAVRLISALRNVALLPKRLEWLPTEPTGSEVPATMKQLDFARGQCKSHIFRCNFYLEIARIERHLGHELIAVVYELRVLRLLGCDRFHLLARIETSLRTLGLNREADAAMAMFGNPTGAEQATYEYLQTARKLHLVREDKSFEVLEDERNQSARVSVIVSLYKAASKLNQFMTALCQQTLLKKGELEIILVDSGSPENERAIIQDYRQFAPNSIVYARSTHRETIQSAWNRGIGLARAPYLVFLGVDEALYPDAIETLAAELDNNPDIDWVMANSLAMAVNDCGTLDRDAINYDRNGAQKDLAYLDTSFLSWVGGMYRRNIHSRFGYYDETFFAAGDTEFKNRILPSIKVKFVPLMLGLFLNYPDERVTVSPRAEVEDLRAWYVHRSSGGIKYAFENRPLDEVHQILGKALGYRKSYFRRMSSDIEYASYLADYLIKNRSPDNWVTRIAPGLRSLLVKLRQLEHIENPRASLRTLIVRLVATKLLTFRLQFDHARAVAHLGFTPSYKVHNDNRYEQHSWLWKS